jgi:hypothetical protein
MTRLNRHVKCQAPDWHPNPAAAWASAPPRDQQPDPRLIRVGAGWSYEVKWDGYRDRRGVCVFRPIVNGHSGPT